MELTYHVTCVASQRKKLVKIPAKDKIVSGIKSAFGVSDANIVTVQVPFEDDWLDAYYDDLPDGGKLRFILSQQGKWCCYFVLHVQCCTVGPRGRAEERKFSVLSPSCARPVADG